MLIPDLHPAAHLTAADDADLLDLLETHGWCSLPFVFAPHPRPRPRGEGIEARRTQTFPVGRGGSPTDTDNGDWTLLDRA